MAVLPDKYSIEDYIHIDAFWYENRRILFNAFFISHIFVTWGGGAPLGTPSTFLYDFLDIIA